MFKLDTRIAEWRARMIQALPQSQEAVDELEEHLREHFSTLQRQGKSEDEAFALAQERVGEPHAIAREFERVPGRWRPGLILLPMLGLLLSVFVGRQLWYMLEASPFPARALLVASLATFTVGFFGVLGSALIATAALLKSARRPLSERERLAVRRMLEKLARLGGVLVAVGWVLDTVWRLQLTPDHLGTSWVYHLWPAGLLVSVALLLFAYSRRATSDRVRWLMAILPFLVVFFLIFGRFIRVASVAWVCVMLIIVQAVLVLPRFRIRVERLHEPLR
jgi:hypothetical protein